MKTKNLGYVLLMCGIVAAAPSVSWFYTRTWCPIDMPVSLAAGSHVETPEFSLNVTGKYQLAVTAGKPLSPAKLECLLGAVPRTSCAEPPAVRVHWVVAGDGTQTEGDSDQTSGAWSEVVGSTGETSHTIGMFEGMQGKRYKVTLDVLADGSKLSAASPRFKVATIGPQYESALIATQLAEVFALLLVISGICLIVVATRSRAESIDGNANGISR